MDYSNYIISVTQALGPLAKSASNPDGGEGFYIEGETRPCVVVCGDSYEFKTAEEAIAKARELASLPD